MDDPPESDIEIYSHVQACHRSLMQFESSEPRDATREKRRLKVRGTQNPRALRV